MSYPRFGVQALSGGEYVLFARGLTAAVTIARGAKIKILMAEAGEADGTTLGKLLSGMKAVEKQVLAAVAITHLPAN